jgi:hypothetical protein
VEDRGLEVVAGYWKISKLSSLEKKKKVQA